MSVLVIEQLLASGGGNCGGHLGLGVQFHLFSSEIPCCDPNIWSKQGVLCRVLDPLAELEWRALAKQGLSTASCQSQNEGRQQGERCVL